MTLKEHIDWYIDSYEAWFGGREKYSDPRSQFWFRLYDDEVAELRKVRTIEELKQLLLTAKYRRTKAGQSNHCGVVQNVITSFARQAIDMHEKGWIEE